MANVKSIFINDHTGGNVPSTTAANWLEIPVAQWEGGVEAQRIPNRNIRNTRAMAGQTLAASRVPCSLQAEFLYGAYDTLLKAALLSAAWANTDGSAKKATGLTLAVDASAKTIDASTGTPFAGLAAGDWVKLEKTSWVNDGICVRVVSLRSSGLGILYDDFTATVTTDASETGVTCRWGEIIKNGTTESLLCAVQRVAQGGSDLFLPYLKASVDGFGLSLAPGQTGNASIPLIAGELAPDFDGTFSVDSDGRYTTSGGTAIAASTYIGSGYTAAPANSPFTPVSTKSALVVNGAPGADFTSFSFQLANNTAETQVLFFQGAKYKAAGTPTLTGSFTAVFLSSTYHALIAADTAVRLACYVVDGNGKGYVLSMPAVKLGGGRVPIGSGDELVTATFTFSAELDSTTSRDFYIQRFDAS